jgi:hypothetical protein
MTAPGAKQGPLSAADIQALWEGVSDDGYTQPLVAAGEGAGFEAWTQMFQQFARVSLAVDVTTQAMYILPGSGQTNPPASRAAFATVLLTVSRGNSFIQWALVLKAGQILVDEQAMDWGPNPGDDGVEVITGRRYALLADLVLPPGDPGPYQVLAQAVRPGYGYNNPLPGSLRVIDQPGSGYTNTGASMAVALIATAGTGGPADNAILTTAPRPDMFQPSQPGQYLMLTAGSNAGAVGRIAGYVAPNPPVAGSGAILAIEQAVECAVFSGTFKPGEPLEFFSGATLVATGRFLGAQLGGVGLRIVYELRTGPTPVSTDTILGINSTATATISTVLQGQIFVNETATASWRVLDWASDLLVSVTNVLSPQGGLAPMLDELGSEREIFGGTNETSDQYRRRVAMVADTTSPNAIRRAIAKVLGQLPWCFREVGDPKFLPGFYYDANDFWDSNCLIMTASFFPSFLVMGEPIVWRDVNGAIIARGYFGGAVPATSTSFVFVIRTAYDPVRLTVASGDNVASQRIPGNFETITSVMVPTCKQGQREHIWLDYLRMRAYFQVGVPPSDDGEFGFFYDTFPLSHLGGFYDENVTGRNFYDGYPLVARARWRNLWQDVERVRAGGVVWDLYEERIGCP